MVTAMRHGRSSVSEDARSCNISDEAALRVQGCQASAKCQEPGCPGARYLYLSVCSARPGIASTLYLFKNDAPCLHCVVAICR